MVYRVNEFITLNRESIVNFDGSEEQLSAILKRNSVNKAEKKGLLKIEKTEDDLLNYMDDPQISVVRG